MRIGFGYDIHRFSPRRSGRPLRLGGVVIPAGRGLAGHSDADVLLHAVADAIFGALGAPDIGEQFPPGEVRTRNLASRVFVQRAAALMGKGGWQLGNLDATVIADQPKLTGQKRRIAQAIATLLKAVPAHVSVKAKTTEGFAPGALGIAAHVVVLLTRAPRARMQRKMRRR